MKRRIFNGANVVIVMCSLFVSYGIVALSNSYRHLQFKESKFDSLAFSAHRVAVAFEDYNDQRFER